MVAADRDRAARHMLHGAVGHPARIGAVTDQIAKEYVARDIALLGVGKASRQGFAIAVNVSQQCDHSLPTALKNFA